MYMCRNVHDRQTIASYLLDHHIRVKDNLHHRNISETHLSQLTHALHQSQVVTSTVCIKIVVVCNFNECSYANKERNFQKWYVEHRQQ